MNKFSLELPKYRLQVHMHFIKRRKPLLSDPVLPSLKNIKKKYRKGSLVGRYFRHIFEHKSIQKIFGSSLAMVIVGSNFIPQTTTNAQVPGTEVVIQAQTLLTTQKGVQLPLGHLKINQNFTFYHPGVDFGGAIGDSVKPIKPGNVVFAGYTKDGYGNSVIIDHGNGLESLYAHLSIIEVKTGQEVSMNTVIGLVGKTGHATGPHLHLEIRLNGRDVNPFSLLNR